MSQRALDLIALALLIAGAVMVSQAPALHPAATLTVMLPQTISDPSDPDMEIADDGTLDPAFEAWAIQYLRGGK